MPRINMSVPSVMGRWNAESFWQTQHNSHVLLLVLQLLLNRNWKLQFSLQNRPKPRFLVDNMMWLTRLCITANVLIHYGRWRVSMLQTKTRPMPVVCYYWPLQWRVQWHENWLEAAGFCRTLTKTFLETVTALVIILR